MGEAVQRNDRTISIFSENFSEPVEFDLDDKNLRAQGHWSDYVKGVAVTLELAGYHLCGAELRIRGEVPIGSGLSSSAALEVASAFALHNFRNYDRPCGVGKALPACRKTSL